MKKYIKSILMAVLAIASISLASCSKSDADADQGKTPFVEYVRVCEPTQSDSLLVGAGMGQRIAFIGQNLGDVQQIWFNDQKAKLNPTYVTSNSIIVDVPSVLTEPENVTNKVRLITSTGIEYVYDFKVIVPNPSITSVSCHYGKEGDLLTIMGDYFIGTEDDVLVYFPGVSEGVKPESYSKTKMIVKVPAGVKEGYLSVRSMYGTSRFAAKFMDTTGMITNFDDGYVNPWGLPTLGVCEGEDGVAGKYIEFKHDANTAWNWSNDLMWGYWASKSAKGNVPVATGDVTKLALRFECNIKTWSDQPILIWFTNYNPNGGVSPDANYAQAHWKPYLKNGEKVDACTNGWVTVTIPLTDFKYSKDESQTDRKISDISQMTDLNLMMFGSADITADVDILFDNFRVVTLE